MFAKITSLEVHIQDFPQGLRNPIVLGKLCVVIESNKRSVFINKLSYQNFKFPGHFRPISCLWSQAFLNTQVFCNTSFARIRFFFEPHAFCEGYLIPFWAMVTWSLYFHCPISQGTLWYLSHLTNTTNNILVTSSFHLPISSASSGSLYRNSQRNFPPGA